MSVKVIVTFFKLVLPVIQPAYADKFAQLADQSQRLQAQSAQKQLIEPQKGLWARVFGK